MQVERPGEFLSVKQRNMRLYRDEAEAVPFVKLIEYLLPPTLDLEGCEIKFPDSVFFGEDGKPVFIAKTDKDGKMVQITQASKLGLSDIRQKFSTLVAERKADTTTVQQLYSAQDKQKKEGSSNQSP